MSQNVAPSAIRPQPAMLRHAATLQACGGVSEFDEVLGAPDKGWGQGCVQRIFDATNGRGVGS